MINEQRLTDTFIALTAIDAESGDEASMRAYLAGALSRLGMSAQTDAAGNLFARLPGTRAGEALLFSAHAGSRRLHRYPSATSSAIISVKPRAKDKTPTLECSPSLISGISSSTTT